MVEELAHFDSFRGWEDKFDSRTALVVMGINVKHINPIVFSVNSNSNFAQYAFD